MKPFKLIKQLDSNDCGIAVIAMLMKHYGFSFDSQDFDEKYTYYCGLNIHQIICILNENNFNAKAIRIKKEDILSDFTLPAIALMEEEVNHFIIIYKIRKNYIYIADPAKGKYKLHVNDFVIKFKGILILAIPTISTSNVKNSMKSLWAFFVSLILPQKKIIIIIILASILVTAIGILGGTFSKIIMDEIIPYELTNKLIVIVIFFSFLVIMQSILNAFRQHIILYLGRKIDIPVSLGYFDHIVNLPMSFFGSKRIGDILTRYQDSGTIKEIVSSLSITLILDIFLAVVSTIILLNISFELYLILILQLILNIILIYIFKKPYEKLNYDLMRLNSGLNSFLIESFQNIEIIKSYSNEKETIYKLEKKSVEVLKRSFEGGIVQNVQNTISEIISTIFPIILYCLGSLYIINKKMTIGDLLFFQTLSVYFMQPVQSLATLQLTFQEAKIAIRRLNELMKVEREDESDKLLKPELHGDIDFKNVSFNYGDRKAVIDDINIKIKKGVTFGIFGQSGSGKTTLVKLLFGFIRTRMGTIFINGYNILDIEPKYVRSKIRYVSQNTNIFTGSLYENIIFGTDGCNIDEINNICKLVGLSEMIENLPDRLNTIIAENGINLSVGERQRISIARALLKGGDIFIFDECTSNLDDYNEKLFMNMVNNYLKDKTVIIISHRKNIMNLCDEVYELINGKLVNFGYAKNGSLKKKSIEQNEVIFYE